MPSVAAWLVARPLNAIIGLAAMMSLPLFGFLSGAVLVFLVLAQGPRQAIVEVLVAGGLILGVTAIVGGAFGPQVWVMSTIWVPALLMTALLLSSRSLTLTLQVSAIIAVVAVLGFYVTVGSPQDYWATMLTGMVEEWRASGVEQLQANADLIGPQIPALAEQMTVWVAFVAWALSAVMLLLGYGLYRGGPSGSLDFGRFRDLNFGRVMAALMALTSVLAIVAGQGWLQGIAFVIFTVFSLQGIAIIHWLHAEGMIPVFVVVLMYGTLIVIVLAPIMVIAMAILGYIDAWFTLRRKKAAAP